MSTLAECHEETASKQPLSPSTTSRTLTSPLNESNMPVNNNHNSEAHATIPNGHVLTAATNGESQTHDVKPRKKLSLPVGNGVTESLPPPKSSWLLRLFESKLFEMSIAIAYLFKSKEPGVLTYLGNKLFVSIILHFYSIFIAFLLVYWT